MSVEPDLLPCPFCGSDDIGESYVSTYSVDSSYNVFGCRRCDARFESGTADDWNRRACVSSATAAKDAEIEALRAEVERWMVPCREWLDKSEWVQQTVKPRELGHHRADILRQRIEQAEARAERLAEALRPLAELDLTGDDFDQRPDSQPIYARNNTVITVGDVRKAIAALLRGQEEGK